MECPACNGNLQITDTGGAKPCPICDVGTRHHPEVGVVLDDLTRRRWEKQTGATEHKPEVALRAALDDLTSGRCAFKHVIVIFAREEPEGSDKNPVGWYQAGSLEHFGQVGLLTIANFIMTSDYGD